MREKKFESFKEQLRRILTLYLLVPITFFALTGYGIMYFLEYNTIRNKNIESTIILEKKMTDIIEDYYSQIDKISRDKDVINAVIKGKADSNVYSKVYKSINSLKAKGNFVFYNSDYDVIMSSSNIDFQDKYRKKYIFQLFGKMLKYPYRIELKTNKVGFNNGDSCVFSIGKAIIRSNKVVGFVVYNILDRDIKKLVAENSYFITIITDRYGNIALATNDKFTNNIGKLDKKIRNVKGYFKDGRRSYYVCNGQIPITNIRVYTISETSHILNKFVEGFAYLLILFLIIIFSMQYAAKIIAKKKTKSIEKLIEAINHIETGDLSTRLEINSNDEFEVIGEAYNKMLLNIEKLIKINEEKAKFNTLTEIKQLESQFNPHFLFNTLEMLRYTIKIDTSMANKIIINISSLLRFSIENKSSEVPLKVNRKYTESYLEIQKYRFGENFDYYYEMEPELENYLVPKLIIQPIIENAIKHGYTQKNKMIIHIKTKIINGKLVITVYDNGKGIEKEILKEIKDMLEKENSKLDNHIGVYNTQRRIKLMYGKDYGLKILSSIGRGTSVKMYLPIKIRG